MTETAHLIYFSPTGTSRTVSENIAKGLGAKEIIHYDLTLPASNIEMILNEGVAIIGIPIYAGRVPELFLERFKAMTSTGMQAVLVALYGNREFEDALVELRDVVTAQGFAVIAGSAFIGEHSYSTAERPIAAGRPDRQDLEIATEFGRQIAAKIAQNTLECPEIDGNVPYRERVKFGGIAPETDKGKCTLCGKCEAVCPTGVITVSDSVVTNADNCIMCCACVRVCEFDARHLIAPVIEERRTMLIKNCSTPKMPKLFL